MSAIPNRPDFLRNRVVIVDGLVGGGKGMMSPILSALPRVEMWTYHTEIDQICGLHHLKHISMEGAVSLIKSWLDEKFYGLSIVRDINCRPKDMSFVFKDARPWRYFIRLFQNDGKEAIQRVRGKDFILNIMTHVNAGYVEPIFNALGDRLVYVRFVRSPMTEYMLNHLARWSNRWGNDIDGMILHHDEKSGPENNVPFFMHGKEDVYLKSSPMDRAILMLQEWQQRGDDVIDKLKTTSSAKIIEVPFERFVVDPDPYMLSIADALHTKIDWITRRMMKKQRVPRQSLSDAPFHKVYRKLGWRSPQKHQSISQEFDVARQLAGKKASSQGMAMLDRLTDQYVKRYHIEL